MSHAAKESPPLLVERDGRVATIVINDAPWNRMSLDFMDDLEEHPTEPAARV